MPNTDRLSLNPDEVALVMATDPDLRALGARTLQSVLVEGAQIAEVESPGEAVNLIAGQFKGKVGLVLAFDNGDNGGSTLAGHLFVDGGEDGVSGSRVPLFLVADSTSQDSPDRLVRLGMVDGVVETPMRSHDVSQVFRFAMEKREGLLGELESASKIEVLNEFIAYYSALTAIWKENVLSLSCRGVEDYEHLLDGVNGAISILGMLREQNMTKISIDLLRRNFHDLNNKLHLVVSYPPFLKEDLPDLPAEEVRILDMLAGEATQLSCYVRGISDAYNGRGFWQNVKKGKLILQPKENLEIPEGTSFCVIDDDQGILRVTQKTIEAAGGSAVSVDSKEALEELFATGTPEIKVFLLDNHLGGGLFGHQLIPLIRSKYPEALIIAHTSDDIRLNADPENEYRKAGVEIVGKRQWRAVGGVVRRKMKH